MDTLENRWQIRGYQYRDAFSVGHNPNLIKTDWLAQIVRDVMGAFPPFFTLSSLLPHCLSSYHCVFMPILDSGGISGMFVPLSLGGYRNPP